VPWRSPRYQPGIAVSYCSCLSCVLRYRMWLLSCSSNVVFEESHPLLFRCSVVSSCVHLCSHNLVHKREKSRGSAIDRFQGNSHTMSGIRNHFLHLTEAPPISGLNSPCCFESCPGPPLATQAVTHLDGSSQFMARSLDFWCLRYFLLDRGTTSDSSFLVANWVVAKQSDTQTQHQSTRPRLSMEPTSLQAMYCAKENARFIQ
jgi:hypothetical protein